MVTPSPGRSAPHQISRIAPFRWHVIANVAPKMGLRWEQQSDAVDHFTKAGGFLIEAKWDLDALNSFTSSNGERAVRRDKFKLGKLCRAMGVDIPDGLYLTDLPYGHPARVDNIAALKKQATRGLKAMNDAPGLLGGSGEDLAGLVEQREGVPTESDDGEPGAPVERASAETRMVERYFRGASESERAEVLRIVSGPVIQNEAKLRQRFEDYLRNTHSHDVGYYKIATHTTVIESDTVDRTARILYEAKGSADRMAVRLAIGQVLDYGYHLAPRLEGLTMSILLPAAPPSDLVVLLDHLEIGCVVLGTNGEFTDLTSHRRCP
jgi:hypothetical protein